MFMKEDPWSLWDMHDDDNALKRLLVNFTDSWVSLFLQWEFFWLLLSSVTEVLWKDMKVTAAGEWTEIMKRTVKVVRRCHFFSISSLPVSSFISILVSRQITSSSSSFFSTDKPIIHLSSGQWSTSSFKCLRHELRTSWTISISRRRWCTFYVENQKDILSSLTPRVIFPFMSASLCQQQQESDMTTVYFTVYFILHATKGTITSERHMCSPSFVVNYLSSYTFLCLFFVRTQDIFPLFFTWMRFLSFAHLSWRLRRWWCHEDNNVFSPSSPSFHLLFNFFLERSVPKRVTSEQFHFINVLFNPLNCVWENKRNQFKPILLLFLSGLNRRRCNISLWLLIW